MTRAEYFHQCNLRRPEFLQDHKRLQREHPRLFDRSPDAESPGEGEEESLRAMAEKYPEVMSPGALPPRQAYPLILDPAFEQLVNLAAIAARDTAGLVTRIGINSGGSSPDAGEIHAAARKAFDDLSDKGRASRRDSQVGGRIDMIFREARLFLPVREDTTLKSVLTLWPTIESAKVACYGKASRGPRQPQYEDRLRIYDDVRKRGFSIADAARHLGMGSRKALRRFNEARQDIEGEPALTPEALKHHMAVCEKCGSATTSDQYCSQMQKLLGSRTGRQKMADRRSPEEAEKELARSGRKGPRNRSE